MVTPETNFKQINNVRMGMKVEADKEVEEAGVEVEITDKVITVRNKETISKNVSTLMEKTVTMRLRSRPRTPGLGPGIGTQGT